MTDTTSTTPTTTLDALIVGAGFSGLGQAAEFLRSGRENFLVLEKSDRLGGVWRDNTYPGAACDTPTPTYCFSYYPMVKATRLYAGQDEMIGYLNDFAEHFGLERFIRYGLAVSRAEWSEEDRAWYVATESGETYRARALVLGFGQLGVPKIPDFPGVDSFKGDSFHSSRWDHSVDLAGKRVASIGAAASAIQYVPEVAKVASNLTVFQRSANYIMPRDPVIFSEEELREHEERPETFMKLRDEIFETREAEFSRVKKGTDLAEKSAGIAIEHMRSQIGDPELQEKFVPDYEFGCKRILRSNDFYPTFNRDNVDLETSPIEEITPKGVRTADGVEHEFDVIVYGTGFQTQRSQGSTSIVGRDGIELDERWGDSPEAYLGIAVDGFPNMFVLFGPNTALNHHSVILMLEPQNRYVADAVERAVAHPETPLEVGAKTVHDFVEKTQKDLEGVAYSGSCSSWYKNSAGRVTTMWSGTVREYEDLVNPHDFSPYLKEDAAR